jgi:hypothetical protein
MALREQRIDDAELIQILACLHEGIGELLVDLEEVALRAISMLSRGPERDELKRDLAEQTIRVAAAQREADLIAAMLRPASGSAARKNWSN